eukprot:CAMPEP_0171257542 /NCGR_PEP_ID=MMETSP0790-20130122/53901_1 /TAXON_ID=2925 /ORGANISM="Alexandrium catenella, Strain OF101" /LENGTH=49 /DNA_ID= /DNA_START= /DNA_END= /DNA_ORIENTATION=
MEGLEPLSRAQTDALKSTIQAASAAENIPRRADFTAEVKGVPTKVLMAA